MGGLFSLITYSGAAYLVWLGIQLLIKKPNAGAVKPVQEYSLTANLIAGLATTLGNPKAILFYLSLFPAFIDLASISAVEVVGLLAMATFSVGPVMAAYAYAASKTGRLLESTRANRALHYGAGCIMVSTGAVLALRP